MFSISKEDIYILKRRIRALGNSLCFYICRIFPIDNKLVSVCTFEGKGGFGCNPKYVVQELHKRNKEIRFVWFVNDMNKNFPDYIRKVPNNLWSRAFWLSRSKVWIDNYRKPYGTIKRKRQCYVNTWHATVGFKNLGLWRGEAFSRMAYLVSKNDSDMIDRMVIDSEWCKEMYPKGIIYDGDYLNVGSPRCDILFGNRNEKKHKFRKDYNIPLDSKVIMFAPTFREKAINGKRHVCSENFTIDFDRLLKNLQIRFGGNWYICFRLHPQLVSNNESYSTLNNERILDASLADDMCEVMAAMDALITDYSSAAMDAACCDMPVFLYADDLVEYIKSRGGMQWNLSTDSFVEVKNNKDITPNIDTVLPFSISQSNDELEKNILNFDQIVYENKLNKYKKDIQLVFNGNASEKVADYIEHIL